MSWDTVGSSLTLEANDSFEVKVTSELSLLLGRKGWKCVPFRICGIALCRGRKEHGARAGICSYNDDLGGCW